MQKLMFPKSKVCTSFIQDELESIAMSFELVVNYLRFLGTVRIVVRKIEDYIL